MRVATTKGNESSVISSYLNTPHPRNWLHGSCRLSSYMHAKTSARL
jgi:hypothetical protein